MTDLRLPAGFSAAGINAGIKNKKKDLGLLVVDRPAEMWAMLTTNRCRAHPIARAESIRALGRPVRALVVTSGAANALTGPDGLEDDRRLGASVARALDVDASEVLTGATGVIGHRLPVDRIEGRLPAAVSALSRDPSDFAEAILTTDKRPKIVVRDLFLGGQRIRLHAVAKGAGMIAPELATTLCCITTDAALSQGAMRLALENAIETTLNQLTVDGDMSTNDAVWFLASGAAGNEQILADDAAVELIAKELQALLFDVARAIARDGEGATRMMEVKVHGAEGFNEARAMALAVADSLLVKAALFGADPGGWGRIMAALGAAASFVDADLDLTKTTLRLAGVPVFRHGAPVPIERDSPLKHKLAAPVVAIEVELGDGPGEAIAFGCDLGYDYVKINADYLRATSASEGSVSVNESLGELGPSIKKKLLIEALRYIDRFKNRRAVIKLGGAGMVDGKLIQDFAEDVLLLESVGLLPLVVHGNGAEIAKALGTAHESDDPFGLRGFFGSAGLAGDMLRAGRVNEEIVAALNRRGNKGVGLSGKDGALLRAKAGGGIDRVDPTLLSMLERDHRVPVISPIGIGEDGVTSLFDGDRVAAELAVALAAEKLIFLVDAPGLTDGDRLVTEIGADRLKQKLEAGEVPAGLVAVAEAGLFALRGGVRSVHLVDGRLPHNLIAELFTDRGIGTLVKDS